MSQRNADVQVTANVSGALAAFDQLRMKVKTTTSELNKSATDNKAAWEEAGRGMLAVGALAGAGVALAIAKFAEFDKAMSGVQAATHESTSNMTQLRDAAIQAGADTAYTAKEAANAIEELAKAGITTADILGGGLSGSLDLAAAGAINVADAASIAATAMTQFSLSGDQVPHVADLLAAGAGKAQGSVQDLSAALNQGGLVAAQTGLTIEETTGTLAAFASAGLLGSDAGTSFKTMLQRLTPISKEAQQKMEELGISAYDAQGNFVGMEKFAASLQNGLKDLTPQARNAALGIMFGSDAVRAASVVYNQGAEGISAWTNKVNDTGFAAETARLRLDNLAGDVEKLGGSFDTALIKSGSGANDVLRGMVQGTTELVNALGSMPAPLQQGVLVVGVLTAGIGLLGGAFLTIVPKLAATRAAMEELNISWGKAGKGGTIAALALTAIAGAAQSYGNTVSLTTDEQERFNQMIQSGNFTNLSKEFQDMNGYAISFGSTVKKFGTDNFWYNYAAGPQQLNGAIKALSFGMIDLGAWADHDKAKLASLSTALGTMAKTDFGAAKDAFNNLAEAAGGSDDAVKNLLATMPEYKAQLTAIAGAQGKSNLSLQEYLDLAQGRGSIAQEELRNSAARAENGLTKVGAAAQDATGKIGNLADKIKNFGNVTLDAREAERQFQAAVDDAAESFKKNGATLDSNTEKGRENAKALDTIAKSAAESAAATWLQTGSEEGLRASLDLSRQKLIDQAIQFGMTKEEATKYADQVLATPKQVMTEIKLDKINESKQAVKDYKTEIESTPATKNTAWNVTLSTPKDFPDWLKSNDTREFPFTVTKKSFGSADGNMFEYANGGFGEGIYAGRTNSLYKFAEPETRWEAFISGRPGMEDRNRKIALEALSRLGGAGQNYASSASLGGGGTSNSTSYGDTLNQSMTVQAAPGMSIEQQMMIASRAMKARQKVRKR